MAELFKVIATFKDEQGKPIAGSEYVARLLDEDRFFDDKLGESTLDADGNAEFLIAAADVLSFDSAGERTPDLYFVLQRNGREVFRSDVFAEVNFDAIDPVTGRQKGLTRAFGPFVVTG